MHELPIFGSWNSLKVDGEGWVVQVYTQMYKVHLSLYK